jgi:hypothetical protein
VYAQLIPIKTIPIAQGNQFQIFPSANLGMGSVSIALEDSLQDPFVNPATGARLHAPRLYSTPAIYRVTQGAGGGRSLPLAVLSPLGSWYGALSLTLQQVDASRPPQQNGVVFAPDVGPGPPPGGFQPVAQPDLRAHGNQFAFGMIGRSVPGRHLSFGASALWNGVHALDGVDLLYAGSRRVRQTGHVLDLRLGALKEWPGEREGRTRSLEAIVLHNTFSARHDVLYADLFWDPNMLQFREQARRERNFDHTNTLGLQLNYQMPLAATGWRVGWLATANRASHPKIPNYELTNVPVFPRDPGRSSAYHLGVGLSKVRGAARFGVDAIYEPIESYTWADAAAPVATSGGDTIGIGGKTIENRFHFSNALLRIGVDQGLQLDGLGNAAALQLGLILHSIHYRLNQADNVQRLQRTGETGWLEWTPTWGLSLRLPDVALRYQGRVTKGGGRPQSPIFFGGIGLADAAGSILAAPSGPMFMTDVSTVTHQITVSLPLH